MRISLTQIKATARVLAIIGVFAAGAPAYAQETGQNVAQDNVQNTVDNGCTDQSGGRHPDCSRLNSGGDRVIIQATDCGNAGSTAQTCPGPASITEPVTENAAQCRTLLNNSNLDYFVPWRTPREWGAFLNWANLHSGPTGVQTYQCCQPQIGTVCANTIYTDASGVEYVIDAAHGYPNGIEVSDPITHQPIQLGKRLLGKRNGNVPYYGAQSDVSNTLDAAILLGNNNINYKVTYVCNNGSWIKTFEQGSCTPLDGACGPNVPPGGVTPLQLSALEQQQLLCASGSILQNLVDHGSYWTWECTGTPNRPTASCVTPNSTVNNDHGACGTGDGALLPGLPTQTSVLCASGIPTAVSGNGSASNPWYWRCEGTSGDYEWCAAISDSAKIDGICGSSNGHSTTNASWNPETGEWWALCGIRDSLNDPPGVQFSPVPSASPGWAWSCKGFNSGNTVQCGATLDTYIGTCGSSDDKYRTTAPTNQLCSVGTATAVTYGMDWENDGRMAWTWMCNGTATPGCDGSGQCTCEAYDQNAPQPGACGDDNGAVYSSTTLPTDLCDAHSHVVSGPTWNATLSPPQWQWVCQGNNGGSSVACGTGNLLINGHCAVDPGHVMTPFTGGPESGWCDPNAMPLNGTISGVHYTFDCPGQFGGATAHCSVTYDAGAYEGICGYAKGAQLNTGTVPADNLLCSSGAVSNKYFDPIQSNLLRWACNGSQPQYSDTSCNAYISPQPGVCGAANGTTVGSKPSGGAACAYGTRSTVTQNGGLWQWTCQGQGGSAATPCSATVAVLPPAATDGACGSADGAEMSDAPTTNLCAAGTATAVMGGGPWTWSCIGSNGGTTAACIAVLPAATSAGACGLADGTTVPAAPNVNLCAGGNPTTVSGAGPWTWDCIGAGVTKHCVANICSVCSGDLAATIQDGTVGPQNIAYGGGSCHVKGTVSWNQVDSLSTNNAAQQLSLLASAAGLSYTTSLTPAAAPVSYCPPCYRRAKTVSGNFAVYKNGACTGSLSDGHTETITIDSVNIQ